MAATTLAQNVTIQPGPIGPFTVAIPAGISQATIAIDRTTWTDPAVQLTLTFDLSLDNGASWASQSPSKTTDPFPVIATAQGSPGIPIDKAGNPAPNLTSIFAGVPSVGSSTRKVKISGFLSGGPLTTTITLITG